MAMRSAPFVQLGVLVVWIALGGVLGYLRAKADGRNYRSEAVVFFDPILSGGESSIGTTTLQQFLTSDRVLQRAIADGQLGKLFEYRDDPQLVATLRGRITINPQRSGPGAYRVVVHGRTAEVAAPTAHAVLQAAQQELGELAASMPAQYLEELKSLVNLLELRSRTLRAIDPAELPHAAPGDIQERIAFWDRQSELLRREIAFLRSRSSEWIAGESNTNPLARESGLNTGAPPAVAGAERPSADLQAMDRVVQLRRRFLEPLLERQRQLAKNFGPDHAELKDVRQRVAILTGLLSTSTPPPEEAVPLLVEEQMLLQQFGPAHPRVQETRKKIDEILQNGTTRASPVRSSPSETTSFSEQHSQQESAASRQPSRPSRQTPLSPTGELLAQKESELAQADHALQLARHDALLHQVRARVAALEEQLQAGRSRLAILSPASAATWDWSRDAQASGWGALLGLLCGLLIGLVSKLVNLTAQTST